MGRKLTARGFFTTRNPFDDELVFPTDEWKRREVTPEEIAKNIMAMLPWWFSEVPELEKDFEPNLVRLLYKYWPWRTGLR